jgi:hypothetical protein
VYYHLLYGNWDIWEGLDWILDGAGTCLSCTNAHLISYLYLVDDKIAASAKGLYAANKLCIYF